MRYDERPIDPTPIHTDDLPPTPIRDRNIPATAWVEAPDSLLTLGDDLPNIQSPSTNAESGRGCCGAPDPPRVPMPATGRPTSTVSTNR